MIWAPIWLVTLIGVALFGFGAFLGHISAGKEK